MTHLDDDHIGNAAAFMNAMTDVAPIPAYPASRYIDRITKVDILYSAIPKVIEQPKAESTAAEFYQDKTRGPLNAQKFQATLDPSWTGKMQEAGIQPKIWLRAYNSSSKEWSKGDSDDWAINQYDWARISNSELQLTYSKIGHGSDIEPKISASVRFSFVGDRYMKAYAKFPKSGKKTDVATHVKVSNVTKRLVKVGQMPELLISKEAKQGFIVNEIVKLSSRVPAPKAQKNRKSSSNSKRLMFDMILMPSIKPSDAFSPLMPRPIVRSVPQVQDLGAMIKTINAKTFPKKSGGTMRVWAVSKGTQGR